MIKILYLILCAVCIFVGIHTGDMMLFTTALVMGTLVAQS